ncbi:hypothetical protein RY831_28385 [Noviherbaspirillum sp. CPCC 100848]|uniref:Uncharacterized protein n=1 Tax=Noviherbaspirillum album TaxID=3080276 RepID=A0ABU6JHE6_9BURK|nr:hypothetical protein [Noviherbaspirillum sp. CPCC 100848]MEC4723084.1 hypothetical protein [Noviherbaspirillum sp. CPCC 100848]
MDTISTKSLAEHLTKLATMLSADAMRLSALGVESHRDLAREATALKLLAERLWLTGSEVPLAKAEPAMELRLGRDRRTLQGGIASYARLSPTRRHPDEDIFKAVPNPLAGSSESPAP